MSRKQRTSLEALAYRLGLEDGDDNPIKGEEIEVAEDGAPIKGDETVEAEELAVDEAADEAEEALDTGDELVEAEQTLESIYQQLRNASESGKGISQESAQFMQIAVENIRIKGTRLTLGMVGIPSCESFGSSNRALNNTNLSMENVGDVLRRVWTWIKEQVNKIIAKIKTWYKNVLGLAPRLKKRAEAIKKKADGTSGSSDESTVELSVHRQLVVGKKAEDPAKCVKLLEAVSTITKKALETGGPLGRDQAEKAITYLNGLDKDTDVSLDAMVKALGEDGKHDSVTQWGASDASFDTGRLGADQEGSTTAVMFGNKAFMIVRSSKATTTAEELKRSISSTKVGFDNFYKKTPETDSSADYKVLTTSQVADVCDSVIDICDYVVDYEKKWQDREKFGKKIQDAAEKVGKRLDKDKDATGDAARNVKAAAMAVYSLWSIGIRAETNVMGYSLGTGRAMLTWCERSLSTYKD